MILYLIRHGQSEGNLESNKSGVIHGRHDDSHLTALGKEQITITAQALKKAHGDKPFYIWNSPANRVKESVEIFKKVLNVSESYETENLYDVNFGDLEGKTWKKVKDTYASWVKKFMNDHFNTPFPGGESIKELHIRVKDFLTNTISPTKHPLHLIVSHEEVIRSTLCFYHPEVGRYHNRKISVPNAKINSISILDDKGVVLQIARDDGLPHFSEQSAHCAHAWFVTQSFIPDEFLPRINYSDNDVFTATKLDRRETVKVIPPEFQDDAKKDIALSEIMVGEGFPAPKLLGIETVQGHLLLRRSFLRGNIAEEWLGKPLYQKQTTKLMGETLKKLHEVRVTKELKLTIRPPKGWKEEILGPWVENDLHVLETVQSLHIQTVKNLFQKFFESYTSDCCTFVHNDFSTHNIALEEKDKALVVSGVWDFERAMIGDPLWDLGVTQKISFLRRQELFAYLLQSYFGDETPTKEKRFAINIYTLFNTTGAIRYRHERGRDTKEEEENLEYVLKKFFP